ncbi:MAG: hypothetical protein HYZ36_08600, partial [Pedosphaera parvula]|nr:hypothetical protein [Pedosphaera parvula]
MFNRLLFVLVTLFWVTMNVMLWRTEFRGGTAPGGEVPLDMVLQKILTAPDNSAMEIHLRGRKIGYCRWSANIGEDLATGRVMSETAPVEGMVKRLSSFSLDLDGSVSVGAPTNRFRFYVGMEFSTNQAWRAFNLRVSQRPSVWELNASAAEQTLRLAIRDEGAEWERTFPFAELRNPEKLVSEFGGPMLAGMAAGVLGGPRGAGGNFQSLAGELTWEARN